MLLLMGETFWRPSYLQAEICAVQYSIAMCAHSLIRSLLSCNTAVPWAAVLSLYTGLWYAPTMYLLGCSCSNAWNQLGV